MNPPSRFDICPYEGRFNWFSYHAQMAEGRGDREQYRQNAALAYEQEILCINWHKFKAMSDQLCDYYSRILMAGRAR